MESSLLRSCLRNVKLLLGKRARSDLQRQEAWWAENRPAAPDLFAREFKDTLEPDQGWERMIGARAARSLSGQRRREPLPSGQG